MKLWQKVTIGLAGGVLFGLYVPQYATLLKPIGDAFLSLIKMVILPLIFFSLVSGMTSMNDPKALGRVGIKATIAFLVTTLFAVLFGLAVALIMEPGVGTVIDFGQSTPTKPAQQFNIIAFFLSIIPSNAVGAFAENNVLQVVFFSIITGITINHMGSAAAELKVFIDASAKLFIKMISFIVELSPYAAFSFISWVISTQGLDILVSLSKLVMSVSLAMALQYLIFGVLIGVFCRMSPMPFYKKSLQYQVIALSSSSSKATLATTMEVCRRDLGVSESSTSFILPLGASINMDGFAINLGLTTIFFAQMLGITLAPHDYLVIILTATLGSIGGAGIPGASLIMLPMVLSSVNLPIDGVAILAGIDRILDMLRTVINITGDATITLIIDESEGGLDKNIYHSVT